jgi:hypothetical protein
MATKVNVVLSSAQAETLLKVLATAPKQTKTIEAITAKVQDAVSAA